jgi:hypothetical protein
MNGIGEEDKISGPKLCKKRDTVLVLILQLGKQLGLTFQLLLFYSILFCVLYIIKRLIFTIKEKPNS